MGRIPTIGGMRLVAIAKVKGYAIVLPEHKNKTTKYLLGRKPPTCHYGRLVKVVLEVAV